MNKRYITWLGAVLSALVITVAVPVILVSFSVLYRLPSPQALPERIDFLENIPALPLKKSGGLLG